MGKVYYNHMRKLSVCLPFLGLGLVAIPGATQQPASLKTASLQSHEGMTITARPWTDAALYKEKFPKKSPYAAGVLALQVAFRNDSDDSVKVNLDRIRLSVLIDEDNRQELAPLTSGEVADAVLRPATKAPTQRRLPFPLPASAPKTGKDKNWTELQTQAQNAAVPTTVVAPHSTVQGLLYFDLQRQFEILNTSHLYIPDILVMQKNRSLTYFEIDLSRPGEI
jgi:hypothetical protein